MTKKFLVDLETLNGKRAVENAAIIAHEANRYYCQSLGDDSQPPWAEAAEWQQASVLAGVRNIVQNPATAPGDSHQRWLEHKIADGWKLGPVKDPEKKEHPNMRPFEELNLNEQAKDHLYVAVVRSALKVYGQRVAYPHTHEKAPGVSNWKCTDDMFSIGMVVIMGRMAHIAMGGVAAVHRANEYPAPRVEPNAAQRERMHSILNCCMLSPDPRKAFEMWRSWMWPDIYSNPHPAEWTMWCVAFGIAHAVSNIEGVKIAKHDLATVVSQTWVYGAE